MSGVLLKFPREEKSVSNSKNKRIVVVLTTLGMNQERQMAETDYKRAKGIYAEQMLPVINEIADAAIEITASTLGKQETNKLAIDAMVLAAMELSRQANDSPIDAFGRIMNLSLSVLSVCSSDHGSEEDEETADDPFEGLDEEWKH